MTQPAVTHTGTFLSVNRNMLCAKISSSSSSSCKVSSRETLHLNKAADHDDDDDDEAIQKYINTFDSSLILILDF